MKKRYSYFQYPLFLTGYVAFLATFLFLAVSIGVLLLTATRDGDVYNFQGSSVVLFIVAGVVFGIGIIFFLVTTMIAKSQKLKDAESDEFKESGKGEFFGEFPPAADVPYKELVRLAYHQAFYSIWGSLPPVLIVLGLLVLMVTYKSTFLWLLIVLAVLIVVYYIFLLFIAPVMLRANFRKYTSSVKYGIWKDRIIMDIKQGEKGTLVQLPYNRISKSYPSKRAHIFRFVIRGKAMFVIVDKQTLDEKGLGKLEEVAAEIQ